MSAALVTWILALARLSAILWVQVLWRSVVPAWGMVAVGLSATLAMLALPYGSPPVTSMTGLLGIVALEVLLGLVIGLLATLPGYALVGATSGSARVLRAPQGPLGALAVCLALAVALGLGLHRPLVSALLETLSLLPLGDPELWLRIWAERGPVLVVRGAHAMLVLTLALVTPVFLAAAMAGLVTRLVARGPGPVPVAFAVLELWLPAAAGILALGASWAAYGHVWAQSATTIVVR
jgi:flagellar biosynthesis protein FliR